MGTNEDFSDYPYHLMVEPSNFDMKTVHEICEVLVTKRFRYNASVFYFKTEIDKFNFFMKYC